MLIFPTPKAQVTGPYPLCQATTGGKDRLALALHWSEWHFHLSFIVESPSSKPSSKISNLFPLLLYARPLQWPLRLHLQYWIIRWNGTPPGPYTLEDRLGWDAELFITKYPIRHPFLFDIYICSPLKLVHQSLFPCRLILVCIQASGHHSRWNRYVPLTAALCSISVQLYNRSIKTDGFSMPTTFSLGSRPQPVPWGTMHLAKIVSH